ncbi:hypothetical protein EAH87_13215 [Sphingomonas koreensis]|nr:hypothetical protein EAH87_13215 [Sphingomonas koreensis]
MQIANFLSMHFTRVLKLRFLLTGEFGISICQGSMAATRIAAFINSILSSVKLPRLSDAFEGILIAHELQPAPP